MQTTAQETNKRNLRVAPFVLALLCFILPFIQISCRVENQTLRVGTLTGLQLVTGTEMKMKLPGTDEVEKWKIPSQSSAVFAVICTAVAAALCFTGGAAGKLLPALLGLAGFISMLVIKKPFDDEMLKTAKESGGLLTIEYGFGFIATCVLLLAGAAICGYHYNEGKKKAGALASPTPAESADASRSAAADRQP